MNKFTILYFFFHFILVLVPTLSSCGGQAYVGSELKASTVEKEMEIEIQPSSRFMKVSRLSVFHS